MESLEEFLTLLWPSLPGGLRSREAETKLARVAREMAPIPNVALEFHSLRGALRIDLQQRVRRTHGEAQLLFDHLCQTRGAAGSPGSRLHRFCAEWLDPDARLGSAIPELYLEYDLGGESVAAGSPAIPSVFFLLEAPNEDAEPFKAARAALERLLLPRLADGPIAGLERCFAACPTDAYVGAVGVMLGRQTDAVRVNLKRVRLENLTPLLSKLDWRGPLEAVERWVGWALDRVDRVTLALDMSRMPCPHLGLECILLRQPEREPRWESLLGELAEMGLCTQENATALHALPGVVTPLEAAAWPSSWIAASLLQPEDRFSTLERQLFYLKLTVADEGRVGAKVYGGAGHVWRLRGGGIAPEETISPSSSLSVVAQIGATSPAAASAAAAEFLWKRQEQTGRWWDFELPAGASDEWVTAFIGSHLAAMPEGRTAAARAWEALQRRRNAAEGWGYNRLTPPDADSTAWALRLADRLGALSSPRACAARSFLERHLLPDGGVTTYAEDAPIRSYTRLPADASMAGWQSAHSCVTAAAAPFLGEATREFLRQALDQSGAWQGYWWWDDEYTGALAVEALRGSDDLQLQAAVQRADAWAISRVGSDGAVVSPGFGPSAFATAWALYLLADAPSPEAHDACRRASGWLARTQLPDGSWAASARLRVAMPNTIDPEGPVRRFDVLDEQRLFTTASVLGAFLRQEQPNRTGGGNRLRRGLHGNP